VHLGNFADVFHAVPLGQQYLNSLVVAAVITAAQLATSVLAAYAFVFLPLKWRKAVFGLFLATLMIPWEAIIIPNYQTISDSGLANTYFALVLPFLASAFGRFMLRQAFLQFPVELARRGPHRRLRALALPVADRWCRCPGPRSPRSRSTPSCRRGTSTSGRCSSRTRRRCRPCNWGCPN